MNEDDIQVAVHLLKENPALSVRKVTLELGLAPSTLSRRIKGGKTLKERKSNNLKLTEAQEVVLCRYVDRLDRMNLTASYDLIRGAANRILLHAAPSDPFADPPTVGVNWVRRFVKRHNYHTQ